MTFEKSQEHIKTEKLLDTLAPDQIAARMKTRLADFAKKISQLPESKSANYWRQINEFLREKLKQKNPAALEALEKHLVDRLSEFEGQISKSESQKTYRESPSDKTLRTSIENSRNNLIRTHRALGIMHKNYEFTQYLGQTVHLLNFDQSFFQSVSNLPQKNQKQIFPKLKEVKSQYENLSSLINDKTCDQIIAMSSFLIPQIKQIYFMIDDIENIIEMAGKENKEKIRVFEKHEKKFSDKEKTADKKIKSLKQKIDKRTALNTTEIENNLDQLATLKNDLDQIARAYVNLSTPLLQNRIHRHIQRLKMKFVELLNLERQLKYEQTISDFSKKNQPWFEIKKIPGGFVLSPASFKELQKKYPRKKSADIQHETQKRAERFCLGLSRGKYFTNIPLNLLNHYQKLLPEKNRHYFRAGHAIVTGRDRQAIDFLNQFISLHKKDKNSPMYRKAQYQLKRLQNKTSAEQGDILTLNTVQAVNIFGEKQDHKETEATKKLKAYIERNKEWYKKNLGEFFLEIEATYLRKTPAELKKFKQKFKEEVRDAKDEKEYIFSDPELSKEQKQLRVLHYLLMKQPSYNRDDAMMSSALTNKKAGANCEGQTKYLVSLIQKVLPNLTLKVQKFADHVQPIVKIGSQWYLVYGDSISKINSAYLEGTELFDPKEFVNIYLNQKYKARFHQVTTPGNAPPGSKGSSDIDTNTNLVMRSKNKLRSFSDGPIPRYVPFRRSGFRIGTAQRSVARYGRYMEGNSGSPSQTIEERRYAEQERRKKDSERFINQQLVPKLKKYLNPTYTINGLQISAREYEQLKKLSPGNLNLHFDKLLQKQNSIRISLPVVGTIQIQGNFYHINREVITKLYGREYDFESRLKMYTKEATERNKLLIMFQLAEALKNKNFSRISPAGKITQLKAYLEKKGNFLTLVHDYLSGHPEFRELLGIKPKKKPSLEQFDETKLKVVETSLIKPGKKESLLYFTEGSDGLRQLKGYIMGYKSQFDALQKSPGSPEQKQRQYRQLLASMHIVHQMFLRGKGHMRSAFDQLPGRFIFKSGENILQELNMLKPDNRKIVCVTPTTQPDSLFLNNWWTPFASVYQLVLKKVTTGELKPVSQKTKSSPTSKTTSKRPAKSRKLTKYEKIKFYLEKIRSKNDLLHNFRNNYEFTSRLTKNPKLKASLMKLTPTELLARYGINVDGHASTDGFFEDGKMMRHKMMRHKMMRHENEEMMKHHREHQARQKRETIRAIPQARQAFETNLQNLKSANIQIQNIKFSSSYFRYDAYLKNIKVLKLYYCILSSATDLTKFNHLTDLTIHKPLTMKGGTPKRLTNFSFLLQLNNLKKLNIEISCYPAGEKKEIQKVLEKLKNKGVKISFL